MTSRVDAGFGSMLETRLEETSMPTRLANRRDEVFVREALRSTCGYLGIGAKGETG